MHRLNELVALGGLYSLFNVGPHDFQEVYTEQWSKTGREARSLWSCTKCDAIFNHYYHREPNIYKAIKDHNIDIDKCNNETYEYKEVTT